MVGVCLTALPESIEDNTVLDKAAAASAADFNRMDSSTHQQQVEL